MTPASDDQSDSELFSASVRQARDDLAKSGVPVTAAQFALALQPHHPGYGKGQFDKMSIDAALGGRRPADIWLSDVAGLYDVSKDQVARSHHRVIDGRLFLAGLAEIDPELRTILDVDGFRSALVEELMVSPRPVRGVDPPASESLFGFCADTPGPLDEITSSDDRLGIEDDVRTLCRLAMARTTQPPLAIGLFGDWGTGKSFFMRRMKSRIREMQDEARAALERGRTSAYCDNVVQIPFNAWNYVDSNLWASLMTRIFEGLTAAETSNEDREFLFSRPESTRADLGRARRDRSVANERLTAIRAERSKLDKARQAVRGDGDKPVRDIVALLPAGDAAPPLPEGVKTLAELRDVAQDARSTARLVRRLLDRRSVRLSLLAPAVAAVTALGVVAAGGGHAVLRVISSTVVLAVTLITAAGVVWRRFRQVVNFTSQADDLDRWLSSQLAEIDQQERRLSRERSEAERRADDAAQRLQRVRSGDLVRQFVETRVTNDAYRDQLGVISLVRDDLRRLSDLLAPTRYDAASRSIAARCDI